MSNSNKALILITACAAFLIGALLKHSLNSHTEGITDTDILLNAQLIKEGSGELEYVKDHVTDLTLINFWASWCAPCRDEMPLFEAMHQRHSSQGFSIVGIAIDSPEKARDMLDSMGITYPILYAETVGMDLMTSVANPQGLLPYSILVDAHGTVLDQVLGKIDEATINTWINTHIAPKFQ